jgi:hypothetical protein
MVKAATKSGMLSRTARPLGPLARGLPPPPSRSAVIFPSPYVWHAWRRSRPCRPPKGDERAPKTIWCPQIRYLGFKTNGLPVRLGHAVEASICLRKPDLGIQRTVRRSDGLVA